MKKWIPAVTLIIVLLGVGTFYSLLTPDHEGVKTEVDEMYGRHLVNDKEDMIEQQKEHEQALNEHYEMGNYTFENPLIVENPYLNAPLSYLFMFRTEVESKIKVTVVGKTEDYSITQQYETFNKEHRVPVIGLYPDFENRVLVTAITKDGNEIEREFKVQTKELPNDFTTINVVENTSTEQDFLLLSDQGYKYLIDREGNIRWYTTLGQGTLTKLENGHLITQDENYFHYYLKRMIEFDYMGKIYTNYYIPGGGHHSITEKNDGNLIINSLARDRMRSVEDIVFEMDRETGKVVSEIDLRNYLDMSRFRDKGLNMFNQDKNDWFHVNFSMIDESDDTLIVSGRTQSIVAKIDYKNEKLKWIITPHEDVSEKLKPYLLEPIGGDFTWSLAQHSSKVLPDLDENPDTTDVMMFDNHINIGTFTSDSFQGSKQYSRAVHYRVNEIDMTIEQIWEYGKEKGTAMFSPIISEVDYLYEKNHALILSGFVNNRDNIRGGIIVEVTKDESKDIIYEAELYRDTTNFIYTLERVTESDLKFDFDMSVKGSYLEEQNAMYYSEDYELNDQEIIVESMIEESISAIYVDHGVVNLSGVIELNESLEESLYVVLDHPTEKANFYYKVNEYDIQNINDDHIELLPNDIRDDIKNGIKRELNYKVFDYHLYMTDFDQTNSKQDYDILLAIEDRDGNFKYYNTNYYIKK